MLDSRHQEGRQKELASLPNFKMQNSEKMGEDRDGSRGGGRGERGAGVELRGAPRGKGLGSSRAYKDTNKATRGAGRGGGGSKGTKRLQIRQGRKVGGSAPSGRNTAGQAVVVQCHVGKAGKAVGGAPGGGQRAYQSIAMQGQALQRLQHTNKRASGLDPLDTLRLKMHRSVWG